jgi:hypothetical protein
MSMEHLYPVPRFSVFFSSSNAMTFSSSRIYQIALLEIRVYRTNNQVEKDTPWL